MTESFRGFFDEIDAPSRSLVVVNRSEPEPVRNLLDSLLEDQSVAIRERDLRTPTRTSSSSSRRTEVIARSTLDELLESVLLINSDLYKTGAIDLNEVTLPDVLSGLDEVPFRLRGYPHSNKEKLLLIVVSRVIERIAAEAGGDAPCVLPAPLPTAGRTRNPRGVRDPR